MPEFKVGDHVIANGFRESKVGTIEFVDYDDSDYPYKVRFSENGYDSDWYQESEVESAKPKPKQDIDSQIKQILSTFDFERVHEVMQLLNWQWFSSTTEDKVPSYGELVLRAQSLMQQAIKGLSKEQGNYFSTGTGGFNVICTRCDDGYIVVDLQFVVANWDNYE